MCFFYFTVKVRVQAVKQRPLVAISVGINSDVAILVLAWYSDSVEGSDAAALSQIYFSMDQSTRCAHIGFVFATY